jgi:predicted AAA+ superfamily ATPase
MSDIQRFFNPPPGSFFLFGPRGTGKSTWVGKHFPEALTLDLLQPDVFQEYDVHPENLRDRLGALPHPTTVVIDEVQKIPALLDVVHAQVELKKGHRFILTGSSARKLKQAGVNLLAGRALLCTLHPFMAAELGPSFNLETALRQGLLPILRADSPPEKTLKTYVGLYLREEVKMEGLVRRLTDFSRFLETVSFSHAQTLNISNISRECGVERKTVEAYVQILDDLLLSFQVPVFTRRAKRELSAHSKFYLFDPGVYRVLRPAGPVDRPEEIDGAALEGLVAQHLRAWLAYGEEDAQLYFWRTRSGVEVDFVVYGPKDFWALEVKNTGRIRPEDLRGLKSFREDYPESKTILLHRGKDRLLRDGILCLPVEPFLKNLRPGHPLENA